jgi:hypothetical protein
VDDAALVRLGHGFAHVEDVADGSFSGDRARLQGLSQILADQVFHHHEGLAVVVDADVDEARYVLAGELPDGLDFASKALEVVGAETGLETQGLHGHRVAAVFVDRAVHHAHGAASDLRHDAIAVGEQVADLG